jgi:hypothetical protein
MSAGRDDPARPFPFEPLPEFPFDPFGRSLCARKAICLSSNTAIMLNKIEEICRNPVPVI